MEMRALGADFLQEGGEGLLISRYSPTEVAVLAPMLSTAEAASLCEQILLDRTTSGTASAGASLAVFAGLADLRAGADPVEQLVHHAEVALYQARAKQSGSPEIYSE
jgi:GGDEF domain-containing protein